VENTSKKQRPLVSSRHFSSFLSNTMARTRGSSLPLLIRVCLDKMKGKDVPVFSTQYFLGPGIDGELDTKSTLEDVMLLAKEKGSPEPGK